jgi:hypothetical protein
MHHDLIPHNPMHLVINKVRIVVTSTLRIKRSRPLLPVIARMQ